MDRKLDELLFFLMQNMTIAVPGEKLARDLGVSHSTLIRWIEKLRQNGIEIHGEPFSGFRLTRLPDVMLPQLIRPRLRTAAIGRSLYHFFKVDSTNAFAARLLSHGRRVPDGTVILAESQSAGRGRLGRNWYSEPETGLYFSLILRPKTPPGLAPLFTLAAAVAMHNAVEVQTGLDVDIKWPNDLLIGKLKFCGILAEIHAELDFVKTLVIGIGVNVNQCGMPDDIAQRATSLRLASEHEQSRVEIFLEFSEQFERLHHEFEAGGPAVIIDAWTRHSSFAFGRKLEINDGVRMLSGVTRGLNSFGALRLEKDGRIDDVYSGDVIRWE
jgi:BirA family biotin operon repressor/biotin-[acetyl-CoA-carboxylase] ligase